MRPSPLLLLLLLAAAGPCLGDSTCKDRSVQSCRLPSGSWLMDQVFCASGASEARHEVLGRSCSDLPSCCFGYDMSQGPVHPSGVRIKGGNQHRFDGQALRVPAGYSVRVEVPYGVEGCLDSIQFRGSMRLTRAEAGGSGMHADEMSSPADAPILARLSSSACHLGYLLIEAESDVDLFSVDLCLLGTQQDSCGVCNGASSSSSSSC